MNWTQLGLRVVISTGLCLIMGAVLGLVAGTSMTGGWMVGIPTFIGGICGSLIGLLLSPLTIGLVRRPGRLVTVTLLCFVLALPVALVSGFAQDPLVSVGAIVASALSCYVCLIRKGPDASPRALLGEKAAYVGPALCLGVALFLAYRQHHYPGTPDELIKVMGENDMQRSMTAAKLLAAHGKERLLIALHNPNPTVRGRAAHQLGFLHDPSVLDPLRHASKDSDRHVRMWVGIALGEVGDPRGLPTLRELASDPEEIVRSNAARAINEIEINHTEKTR